MFLSISISTTVEFQALCYSDAIVASWKDGVVVVELVASSTRSR